MNSRTVRPGGRFGRFLHAAGYALVGAILVLSVIRLIVFSVMDSQGI